MQLIDVEWDYGRGAGGFVVRETVDDAYAETSSRYLPGLKYVALEY